ncbi:MAG: EAL domain-containing protein [Burkholderiales bacterium]|nr:EAL domain-containing protein [Burkholderiales bacterium]
MQHTGVLETPSNESGSDSRPLAIEDVWRGIENQQFLPHFQPKVSLRGMELKGMEALIRWQHPQRGLLTAGSFLPLITDNFLFDDLAFVMLERSVGQCRRWLDDGLQVPVSVNLTPDLLRDGRLTGRIQATMARAAVPAEYITIEVAEAAVAQKSDAILETLLALRVAGFGVAVDDYGTGRCDREQLERIPASELKIDRMMLAGAARDAALKAQLQASVELARDLNFTAVAEGIETREEWDLVNELGCDMAQGWFIAHAMPGEDLADWLLAWNADPFL